VLCCQYFFAATPGWDAATGLGTPNFQTIANLVINNATYFPYISAYPNGKQSSSSTENDDLVETKASNALIIAIVGLSFAFVIGASIALYYLLFFK
jgi:hypothetical protein